MPAKNWYSMDVEQVSGDLNTDLSQGLDKEEVGRRLNEDGPNVLQEPPPRSLFFMFVAQMKEVLVLILIGAALISGILGEWEDTIVILVIVVLNAALGVYQENKAEQALKALQEMTKPLAKVIRGGTVSQVDVKELVPGDLVLLETGDSIPADVRLVETVSLRSERSCFDRRISACRKRAHCFGDRGHTSG